MSHLWARLWEQLCLLFLTAGVLAALATLTRPTWEVDSGQCQWGMGRWDRAHRVRGELQGSKGEGTRVGALERIALDRGTKGLIWSWAIQEGQPVVTGERFPLCFVAAWSALP